LKAFACPQCGASLKSGPVKSSTIECPYCHSAVIVPLDLRPPPPPPPPSDFGRYHEPVAVGRSTPTFGTVLAICCVGVVVFLIILAIAMKARRATSVPTSRPTYAAPTKPTPTPYVLMFGAEGTGPGLFQDAKAVAVDASGNVYVSDDTLRIQKFDSNGSFIGLWTIPASTKYFSKVRGGPDTLFADRDGNVNVVIGGVVLKYDGAGELLGAAQGSDSIQDATPKADGGMVVISANGGDDELVVLDQKGKAVKRVHRFLSSQLEKDIPVDALKVAVDGLGNIFAMYALGSVYGEHWYDDGDLAVFRFTADGKYVNRFGGGGSAAGQFQLPNALAVDAQSKVYVCDQTKGIHVFTSDGRFLETLLTPFYVSGMAFDKSGDLFIVGSNTVSKLSLNK
jgi:DNA-directed RNA polymerase subunit RPC12/RpoP